MVVTEEILEISRTSLKGNVCLYCLRKNVCFFFTLVFSFIAAMMQHHQVARDLVTVAHTPPL